MARVLLLTTADTSIVPYARRNCERLLDAASHDRFHEHSLTSDPCDADVILFIESTDPNFRDVRTHPWARNYPEKCFHFHSGDKIIPFLPGIYPSIEKRWYSPYRTRSGFYPRVFDFTQIEHFEGISSCPYLYSFLGKAGNAPVRQRILQLKDTRGLRIDTSLACNADSGTDASVGFVDQYIDSLRNSKFVLCPRGGGTSSFRIFETMKAGRVPVILSDQWVPPEGPRWERCCLRVAERDVASIPALLGEYEAMAVEMGQSARREWESWFSKEVAFHRVVEWCLAMQRNRPRPERRMRWAAYLQLLRPYHFRHSVLGRLKHALFNLSI